MKHLRKYCLGLVIFGGLSVIAFAGGVAVEALPFPVPLDDYGDADLIKSGEIMGVLTNRIGHTPFNLWASLIFLFAILHTFFAAKITVIAGKLEQKHAKKMRAEGRSEEEIEHNPPFLAEILHFFGEVEAIFGIWVLALGAVTVSFYDWDTFKNYIAHTVNFTEPMFVVVIMALSSTRPIMLFAKQIMGKFAALGKHSPGAWWLSILTLAPLLGSFITEPAAMTIGAMLLAEQFYRLKPSSKLAYATIGILFVNVSVGGTITHFAAP
ncbi:MAG: putative Na+/H+ antiporter, partial [SAR324 cluster bacterium]|nr:putative Na+/H+ antiporter [SAR324 cluster bacterium]